MSRRESSRIRGLPPGSSSGEREEEVSSASVAPVGESVEDERPIDAPLSTAEARISINLEKRIKNELDLGTKTNLQAIKSSNLNTVLNYFNHLIKTINEVNLSEMPSNVLLDNFESWKLSTEIQIKSNPTLRDIVFTSPMESWAKFKEENSKIFNFIVVHDEVLAKYYQQIHTTAFFKLFATVQKISNLSILNKLKSTEFEASDDHPNLTENANALWKLLLDRFKPKTKFILTTLTQEFNSVQYKIGQEPMEFINKVLDLNAKLEQAGPHCGYTEEKLTLELFTKLPPQMAVFKQNFIATESSLTLENFTKALQAWHIQHTINKSNTFKNKINFVQDNKNSNNSNNLSSKNKFKNKKKFSNFNRFKRKFENYNNSNYTPNNNNTNYGNQNLVKKEPPLKGAFIIQNYNVTTESHISDPRLVYLDSGASSHYACTQEILNNVKDIPTYQVISAMNQIKKVNIAGDLNLTSRAKLTGVNLLPGSIANLASVAKIVDGGVDVLFNNTGGHIVKRIPSRNYFKLMTFNRKDNLFAFNLDPERRETESAFEYDEEKKGVIPRKPQPIQPESGPIVTGITNKRPNRNINSENANKQRRTNQQNNNNNVTTNSVSLLKDYDGDFSIGFVGLINAVIKLEKDDQGNDINYWHKCLGHQSLKTIKKTLELAGIKISKSNMNLQKCEHCIMGKQNRRKVGKITANPIRAATEIMQTWHADLIGPISIKLIDKKEYLPSLGNNLYVLVIVDEFSRYIIVKLLTTKIEAIENVINSINLYENATKIKLQHFHSDQGSEFTNNILTSFLRERGIEQTFTSAYTPSDNPIVEAINGKIFQLVRTLLINY
jgi:hypothetical protein